jgi:hypothetical protein
LPPIAYFLLWHFSVAISKRMFLQERVLPRDGPADCRLRSSSRSGSVGASGERQAKELSRARSTRRPADLHSSLSPLFVFELQIPPQPRTIGSNAEAALVSAVRDPLTRSRSTWKRHACTIQPCVRVPWVSCPLHHRWRCRRPREIRMAGCLRPLAYLTHVSERCRQVADPSTRCLKLGWNNSLLLRLGLQPGNPPQWGPRAVPFFLRANNSGVFV